MVGILGFAAEPVTDLTGSRRVRFKTYRALGPRLSLRRTCHWRTPTIAFQEGQPVGLRSTYNEAQSLHLSVTVCLSLCLRFVDAVTVANARLDSRWLASLSGAGISPAEHDELARRTPFPGKGEG